MKIDFNTLANAVKNHSNSELSELFNYKLTENGDLTHKSTGNQLLDLIFQAEYYQKHLNEVKIGNSDLEKLFAMFMRDPRHGMKYRDLGRILMSQSGLSPEAVAFAGRFDDLWEMPQGQEFNEDWLKFLFDQCRSGNELAKKWMPHYVAKKDGKVAKSTLMACHMRNLLGMTKQEYNKFVKCPTVESKLSQGEQDEIEFDKIPTLALLKYWARFAGTNKAKKTDMADRFQAYLDSVKKGEKKMNFSTATVYDIYRKANTIDTDLAFSQIEKISGNWIPIVDTSSSMFTDDAMGKALSIGHYLAKTSTYCPNQVITFSAEPHLITLGDKSSCCSRYGNYYLTSLPQLNEYQYNKEIRSMYTGDCSNTDFAAVMKILSGLKSEYPEYLIVLSDMEFDFGGYQETNKETMKRWRERGIKTKLVWWNLNSRNRTSPQSVRVDANGSIFISGYDPTMLKFLACNFNAEQFISKLLTEYAKNIPDDMTL